MKRPYALLVSFVLAPLATAAGCGDKKDSGDDTPPEPAKTSDNTTSPDETTPEHPSPSDAAPVPDATPPDPTGEFDAQARAIFRVAACAGDDPIPEHLSAKVVEAHCERFNKIVAQYKEQWLDEAIPFLRGLVPDDLPDVVFYPFGGEDLVSALAVFPDAREITIVSLEEADDPRVIDRIAAADLAESLRRTREHLDFLMDVAFHRTEDLKEMGKDPLPEQIVGALWALSVHDRLPVSLRFFTLEEDGSLAYTTEDFTNFELTFRTSGGPLQTYRHIAQNLVDRQLEDAPGFIAYVEARAPFAAITKAASFLLWQNRFSTIRDLLLDNMVWLISDATAPLPKHARAKGFELVPYGRFTGPEPAFGDIPAAGALVELWKKKSQGPVPVRWGYLDANRGRHLLITRKKKAAASKPKEN